MRKWELFAVGSSAIKTAAAALDRFPPHPPAAIGQAALAVIPLMHAANIKRAFTGVDSASATRSGLVKKCKNEAICPLVFNISFENEPIFWKAAPLRG